MEYSIWKFFGVIWSALGFTLEVKFFCHMEYSIWLFYDAIWSTPYGRNQRPHGVLHNVINNIHSYKVLHKTFFDDLMDHFFMQYGLLHMAVFVP